MNISKMSFFLEIEQIYSYQFYENGRNFQQSPPIFAEREIFLVVSNSSTSHIC